MDNVNMWKELPELDIPVRGAIELTVLKAGIMVVSLPLLLAAEVADSALLLDESQGVLGTIVVSRDGSDEPILMRLPHVVAGWAAECCAVVAQEGRRPFPARIRFRRVSDAVEVTIVDLAEPAVEGCAMGTEHLVVYVDESGNTGDAAVVVDTTRLFGDQPSFALVGIGEEVGSESLARIMSELRARHGVQAEEIKSRTMDRYPAFVGDLVRSLQGRRLPVFVELMDKQFYVATNVVSFVLGGVGALSSEHGRVLANGLADVLTEEVDVSALVAYCELARAPSPETFDAFKTTFGSQLISALQRASRNARDVLEVAEKLFRAAVDACGEADDANPTPYARMLPPPDTSLHGKLIAMLPHVPAFAHLYGRVNRFSHESTTVHVKHDEQSHFGALLQDHATTLESNRYAMDLVESYGAEHAAWRFVPGKFALSFTKSHHSAGIQAADVVARFCTRRLNAIIKGSERSDDEVAWELARFRDATSSVGVNIVSTTRRAKRFFRG